MRSLTSRLRRRGLALAAAGAGALALAGGIAYATIPDAGGGYTACVLNATGTIRLIDPSGAPSSLKSHCTSVESQIAWNAKGPAGPQGVPGSAGHDGADNGPAYSDRLTSDVALPSNGSVPVVQLTLGPGSYVFTASVTAASGDVPPAGVACSLYDTTDLSYIENVVGSASATIPALGPFGGSTTLSLTGADTFTVAKTVVVGCGGFPSGQRARSANLVAIKVRSIN